jgi:hypothetical protein
MTEQEMRKEVEEFLKELKEGAIIGVAKGYFGHDLSPFMHDLIKLYLEDYLEWLDKRKGRMGTLTSMSFADDEDSEE